MDLPLDPHKQLRNPRTPTPTGRDIPLNDPHSLVDAVLARIQLPSKAKEIREAHKAIADYAQHVYKRGVSKQELDFLELSGRAFGSSARGINLALMLTQRLGAEHPSEKEWQQLRDVLYKFVQLNSRRIAGSTLILQSLVEELSDLSAWKGLLEQLSETCPHLERAQSCINALSPLSGRRPQQVATLARVLCYGLRYRLAPHSIECLANACPQSAGPHGNVVRNILIDAESSTTRPKPVSSLTQTLEAISQLETSACPPHAIHSYSVLLRSLEADKPAQIFLSNHIHARINPRNAHALDALFADYLTLTRRKCTIAYIPPAAAEKLATATRNGRLSTERVAALAEGLSIFAERASRLSDEKPSSSQLAKLVSSILKTSTWKYVFGDDKYFSKLILLLEGKYVDERFRINSIAEMQQAIVELKANGLILQAAYAGSPIRRRQFGKMILTPQIGYGDNPPFSLFNTDRDIQKRFMAQVYSLYRRQFQQYWGASAYTYEFRHTPISRRCPYDEFASRIASRISVIPSVRGQPQFPGNGRLVEGFIPERVFAPDSADSNRDPFHRWVHEILRDFGPDQMSRRPGERHPIRNARTMRYLALRGMRALEIQGDPFFTYHSEPLSFITYTDHLDATGLHMSILVPSRALWPLVEPHAIPYRPGIDPFPTEVRDGGIGCLPPTVEMLRIRCHELKTSVGVINLGWGSNFGGGFCNALEPGSHAFHGWELTHDKYKDRWGHSHKWYLRDDPILLRQLLDQHEDIYSIANSFFNHLDLIHLIEAFDACGFTRGGEANSDLSSGLHEIHGSTRPEVAELEELWGSSPPSSFMLHEHTLDAVSEFDEEWRKGTRRWLDWASLHAFEHNATGTPVSERPILVLASTTRLSDVSPSPFIFDTATGIVWRKDGPPLLLEQLDGTTPQAVAHWWDSKIAPLLIRDRSIRPRLLARDNYISLMREMGAKV